ncbi:MAG: 3-hydroxybutyrate dehydrogenase [Rhodospirillales bacterium]
MLLKGKSAIVTGSTSGIGLGIARAFAKEGADILLNGFGPQDDIEKIKADVRALSGAKVEFVGADVSKEDDCAGMVATATQAFGKVDILVNNAGIQFTAPVHAFPTEKWNAVVATNLSSVFYLSKAVLPQMLGRRWGRIINIASAHGMVASKEKAAYVAAKHGVLGLTKVTALDTAGTGVTANAICPGWVLTPLVQKQVDALAERKGLSKEDAAVELLSEKMPSKQFVTPEQLGGLAVFLCTDAAAQMTGTALPMDGGWTAQ